MADVLKEIGPYSTDDPRSLVEALKDMDPQSVVDALRDLAPDILARGAEGCGPVGIRWGLSTVVDLDAENRRGLQYI